MDSKASRRGQILVEMLWTVLLMISFASFLLRLHQNAKKVHQKPRWEIQSPQHSKKAT